MIADSTLTKMWKLTTGKLILGLQLARPTPYMSIEKREFWQIIFLTIIQLFIYIDAATVLARIREIFMSVPLPELISEVFVREIVPSNRFK